MRLLFATSNKKKLAELRGLVGDQVEVASAADYPEVPEPIEDGATFEENARKKAEHYARATGLPALADDSGLCVDALDGAPGVYSARYAAGNDRDRYEKLLRALETTPDDRRGAAFRCALCLVAPGQPPRIEVGECRGRISRAPRGEHGFGYDPVFVLDDAGRTMAELTPDQKAALSHRGRAMEKMRPHLLALARTQHG